MRVDGGQRTCRTAPGRRSSSARNRIRFSGGQPSGDDPPFGCGEGAEGTPHQRQQVGELPRIRLPTQRSSSARKVGVVDQQQSAVGEEALDPRCLGGRLGTSGQAPAPGAWRHRRAPRRPGAAGRSGPAAARAGRTDRPAQPRWPASAGAGHRGLSLSKALRQLRAHFEQLDAGTDLVDPAGASPPRCRRPAPTTARLSPAQIRTTQRLADLGAARRCRSAAYIAVALGPGQRRQRLHQVHVRRRPAPPGRPACASRPAERVRQVGQQAALDRPGELQQGSVARGAWSTRAVAADSTVVPHTEASTSRTAYSGVQRDAQVSRKVPWLCDVAARRHVSSRGRAAAAGGTAGIAPDRSAGAGRGPSSGSPAHAGPASVRQVRFRSASSGTVGTRSLTEPESLADHQMLGDVARPPARRRRRARPGWPR